MTFDPQQDIYADIFGDDSDIEEVEELKPIGTSSSLFSSKPNGQPEKDIGDSIKTSNEIDGEELKSIHQHTLNQIYKLVGGKQLTRSKMAFVPSWVLDRALQEELDSNRHDTHDEVKEHEVGANANVIPSHVVYKVKNEEQNFKRMKARLCPNGNRDKLRKTVRKDSASAQFDVVRMLLSLTTLFRFRLACIDIKGAYLQSGQIKRCIYVRAPRELGLGREIL